jgi:hypothetical protein
MNRWEVSIFMDIFSCFFAVYQSVKSGHIRRNPGSGYVPRFSLPTQVWPKNMVLLCEFEFLE